MRSDVQPHKPESSVNAEGGPPISEPTSPDIPSEAAAKNTLEDQSVSEQAGSLYTDSSLTQNNTSTGMRNQMSSSRAMTVELNTLKDMTPKLMREVHTYTIGECQHVKELEKNLPFCREHRDVRFNLVLEEIHRLRENRIRTLEKLKETHIKIAELEFRLELTSFQAGEIFWDQKLAELAQQSSIAVENSPIHRDSREFQPNFEFAPVIERSKPTGDNIRNLGYTMDSSTVMSQAKPTESNHEQGLIEYGDKVVIEPKPSKTSGVAALKETLIESIESYKSKDNSQTTSAISSQEFLNSSTAIAADNQSLPQQEGKLERSSDLTSTIGSKPAENRRSHVSGQMDQAVNRHSYNRNSQDDTAPTEIDELISGIEESKRQSNRFRRRLLLYSAIPSAAAIAILILELQTKVISNLFNHLPK